MTNLGPVWDQIKILGSALEVMIARLEKLEGKTPATSQAAPRATRKPTSETKPATKQLAAIEALVNQFEAEVGHTTKLLQIACSESNDGDAPDLEIDIVGGVDSEMSIRIVGQLMNNPNAETITVRIDSNGGCVSSAELIATALLAHPATAKTAIVEGTCSSAAVMLALCCTERHAHNDVTMNLHRTKPLTGNRPRDKDSSISCLASDEIEIRIARRAGVDVDAYRKRRAEDAFLGFDECTAIGILTSEMKGVRHSPVAFRQIPDGRDAADFFSFETVEGEIYFKELPMDIVKNLAATLKSGALCRMNFASPIMTEAERIAGVR